MRAWNFPPWLPAFSGSDCAHRSQVSPAWKVGRRNNLSSRLALPASSTCSPACRSVNPWMHCVLLALQPAVVRWVCKAKRLHFGRAGEGSLPPPPAVSPSSLTWWMSSWMCRDQGAPETLFGSTFFTQTHTPRSFFWARISSRKLHFGIVCPAGLLDSSFFLAVRFFLDFSCV